jgi:hypothetical protein
MQTAIRVIEGTFGSSKYRNFEIQILEKSNTGTFGFDYYEPIGSITFQTHKDCDYDKIWYGLRFHIDTEKFNHILKMGKLAKYIKENSYHDVQPIELIKLIGGIEYHWNQHELIPNSAIGMQMFKVYRGESCYSKIIAANEIKANKIFDSYIQKYQNYEWKLEFSHIIEKA